MFSSEILPLYFGFSSACHEVGLRLDVLRVVVDLDGRPRERVAHVVRAVLPEREAPRDRVELLRGRDLRERERGRQAVLVVLRDPERVARHDVELAAGLLDLQIGVGVVGEQRRPALDLRGLVHGRELVVRVVVRPRQQVERGAPEPHAPPEGGPGERQAERTRRPGLQEVGTAERPVEDGHVAMPPHRQWVLPATALRLPAPTRARAPGRGQGRGRRSARDRTAKPSTAPRPRRT